MALPDSFHTADRIIRQALRDSGRLQFGANPTPEQLEDARDRLADLIYSFQTEGIKLWLNSIRTLTLVAGTATYDLDGPRELRATGGWYVLNTGNRRPINQESYETFYRLGDLTQQGNPVSYFIDKQQTKAVCHLWLIPDASAASLGTVELLVQTQPVVPVELDDDLGFPVEWYMALRWGLADDLATGQPESIMNRCEKKAAEHKSRLEDWDVEDADVRFAPERQFREHSPFNRR
jgi:hypothetical protein